MDGWMEGGRRGAPLRTDRVLHPLAFPLICVSDDTQPFLTLSQSGTPPSFPRTLRSSCSVIRRARLVLRMLTARRSLAMMAAQKVRLALHSGQGQGS